MIKVFFPKFFKRFFGLFICMVFISVLSVGLLCCFGSSMINVRANFKQYMSDYGNIDEVYQTNYMLRSQLKSVAEDVPEVEEVYPRLTLDAYMKKEDRTIVSRIFSYRDTDSSLFQLYPIKGRTVEKSKKEGVLNISVARKFANNNKFEPGQTVKIGFLNYYIDCYIYQIVESAEAIYPRANSYIWSDNYDFGFVYALESELDDILVHIATKLIEKYSPEQLKELMASMSMIGLIIPDFSDLSLVGMLANQLLIRNVEGVSSDVAMLQLNSAFDNEGIKVTSSTKRANLPHVAYINHALEQVTVASIFLPVFFYSVTMVVVGLFLNQIIKTMTPQIGIFMSIGIDTRDIVKLFLLFSTLVGVVAGVLGSFVGYGLNAFISSIMKETYSIPMIRPSLNVFVAVGAIVGLLAFITVTTLITCRAIFSITPKDAVISNEAKRKKLPKKLDDVINKSPMNIKLGLNSIFQNPKRFMVSTFSIFASLVLIIISTFFIVSKDEMIDQSLKRRLRYDAQIYLTEKVDNSFYEDLKDQEFITDIEECYYTYVQVDNQKKPVYLECLAVDEGYNDMIAIPNSRGRGSLEVTHDGIILPRGYAKQIKAKKGDSISINGVSVTVTNISYQYFHPITYLSKQQMEQFDVQYISSFLVNTKDENALLSYLTENQSKCLTVFTRTLSNDIHHTFDSLNVMVYIMVGFSIGMAFIILCIMSQNALMEQQRSLSVLRLIGYTIRDISNVWTLQSISQLIFASIVAVPIGCWVISILLSLCSSPGQIYPFIMSWPTALAAIGFVFIVVVLTHFLSMYKIYKWNLADNTRTRE